MYHVEVFNLSLTKVSGVHFIGLKLEVDVSCYIGEFTFSLQINDL